MNLAFILEATAREHPGRVALRAGGRSLTYAALDAQVNRLAHGLRVQGLAAFEMVDGCQQFWGIPAGAGELTQLAGQRPWTDLVENQPDQFDSIQLPGDTTCSITFTSGTTGAPKGTEHTHTTEYLSTVLVRDELGVRHDDVALSALPLFSLWRCAILHATFLSGSTAVLLPRFDPVQTWRAMEKEGVTLFYGVPAMFYAMGRFMEDASVDFDRIGRTWRASAYGGAPLDLALRRRFQQRFELDIRQGYGLTEVVFAVLDTSQDNDIPEFIGRPIPGVQIRIVDEEMNNVPPGDFGEIVVRTPTAMKAYYGQPEWTEEAFRGGWFHTGDVGRRDEDGNLYLMDRIKDMINRGGYKVYPAQVEAVLRQHPAVGNVAVLGIPNERLGEEVKALVVLNEDAACTEDELITWARERVAQYAYPRLVEFVDSLPLSPTGKVLKRLLRERARV